MIRKISTVVIILHKWQEIKNQKRLCVVIHVLSVKIIALLTE